jgi:hypothetical protein
MEHVTPEAIKYSSRNNNNNNNSSCCSDNNNDSGSSSSSSSDNKSRSSSDSNNKNNNSASASGGGDRYGSNHDRGFVAENDQAAATTLTPATPAATLTAPAAEVVELTVADMAHAWRLLDSGWKKEDDDDSDEGMGGVRNECDAETEDKEGHRHYQHHPPLLVALGNPHLSLTECEAIANHIRALPPAVVYPLADVNVSSSFSPEFTPSTTTTIEGAKRAGERAVTTAAITKKQKQKQIRKHRNARIVATLGREVHGKAKEAGFVGVMEEFGVELVNDTCWCMVNEDCWQAPTAPFPPLQPEPPRLPDALPLTTADAAAAAAADIVTTNHTTGPDNSSSTTTTNTTTSSTSSTTAAATTMTVVLTNSAKFAHYAPGLLGESKIVRFAGLAACVQAASTGKCPAPPNWVQRTHRPQ